MFKRFVSLILITVLSLVLFTGCSGNNGGTDSFDAAHFVDECKILVPAKRYSPADLEFFEIDFAKAVLDKFAKSNYYKNMTEDEKKAAFKDITDILSAYSYGDAKNGFMKNISVNMVQHTVSWTVKDSEETEIIWKMPGY